MSLRLFLVLASSLIVLASSETEAASRWRLIETADEAGRTCVTVGGEDIGYCLLDPTTPATMRVRGPRRLKIVTRYLYPEGESGIAQYRLLIDIDGESQTESNVLVSPVAEAGACGNSGRVGALRRAYISVPSGWHDVSVTASTVDGGSVAARFLRELKSRSIRWSAYAPERFGGVGHLQFESGERSTYYRFDSVQPLAFKVSGPTSVEIWTRLDFDHTMSGVQPYSLEVVLDGKSWRTFHYDTSKLDSAVWIERPDMLPGERRTMRLKIPNGTHRVEIRCLKPSSGGLAAKIRIPERDIR